MRSLYRAIAYLSLASVFGTLLYGFRYDPGASKFNILLNIGLYLLFAAPHLILTRPDIKKRLWGDRAGTPVERQFFILLTALTLTAVYILHLPIPGPAYAPPIWLTFTALLAFLLCVVAFFEGATFSALDGLLGVPGSALSHSHGGETPLLTKGAYAGVRHPMYRAAVLAGLCSILIHANAAAVLWALMIGATFILFIPIEERQLLAARGDDYRAYMNRTPYRLFRGIW